MDSDTDYADYDNDYYSETEDTVSESEQHEEFYDNDGLEYESELDYNNAIHTSSPNYNYDSSESEDDATHTGVYKHRQTTERFGIRFTDEVRELEERIQTQNQMLEQKHYVELISLIYTKFYCETQRQFYVNRITARQEDELRDLTQLQCQLRQKKSDVCRQAPQQRQYHSSSTHKSGLQQDFNGVLQYRRGKKRDARVRKRISSRFVYKTQRQPDKAKRLATINAKRLAEAIVDCDVVKFDRNARHALVVQISIGLRTRQKY